jgi:hypothetical protein
MARVRPPSPTPDPRHSAEGALLGDLETGLPDPWLVLRRPLPELTRDERLRFVGWALVGPPGVLWLEAPFGARWEAGGWWNGGHGCTDPFTAARQSEDRLRGAIAPRARAFGGADLVLGHGIVFGPGGLDPRAPGDRFVTYRPAEFAEPVASFVDRLVARGRVARRVDRPPFTRADVDAIATLIDPTADVA